MKETKIGGIFLSQDEIRVSISKDLNKAYLNRLDLKAIAPPKVIYKTNGPPVWDNPDTVLNEALTALKAEEPDRISVASFGPFESLDQANEKKYGQLVDHQPQSLLNGMNIVSLIKRAMEWDSAKQSSKRVFVNTDVNCGAIAEFAQRFVSYRYPFQRISSLQPERASYIRASSCLVYVIIGHGIGAAQTWGGFRVRDRLNPEMGHVPVKPYEDDPIGSQCHYHDSCVEGFASNYAHTQRILRMEKVAAEKIRASYVAQFLGAIHLMIAPNVIVVDGPYTGKEQKNFLQDVRHEFQETMGGEDFYPAWRDIGSLDDYISQPFCDDACIRGAIFMATGAFQNGLASEMKR